MELNKQHEIVRQLSHSLRGCLTSMRERWRGQMDREALFDNHYTQAEVLDRHLDLLKFLLKEGDLYLSWNRCEELWQTLVADQYR